MGTCNTKYAKHEGIRKYYIFYKNIDRNGIGNSMTGMEANHDEYKYK
ncbi:MAG: hypothetical protein LIO99_05470 [Clostridiales bacterium]|nr:hypothetical protein [Clostridiales bacterium]